MVSKLLPLTLLGLGLLSSGCSLDNREETSGFSVGYRTGVRVTDSEGSASYTSSGERGNVMISEVNWAGSVEGPLEASVHYGDDLFIEVQNKHPRPIWLTGWRITVHSSPNRDRLPDDYLFRTDATKTYILPAPRSGKPLQPNEYALIAVRADGAFPTADYIVPDLKFPEGSFAIDLFDIDERIIEGMGDIHKERFAGSWDLVTARSMERSQSLFGNSGSVDGSWHSYSGNDFDLAPATGPRLHDALRVNVAEAYRPLTFATPGLPNSPDYAGIISSGAED